MKISDMKMTVTLDAVEVKKILADYVAKELKRTVNEADVSFILNKRSIGGRPGDNDYEHFFKNAIIEVKGT